MRIIIILFCFISSIVFSQDVSTKIEDINGDNFKDTIRIFYEGGSGFGGKFCTLINGKTNEIHKMDNWGCYCQIKNIILIPPALRK